MKKIVERAFAVSLLIVSIISTIWNTELLENIVYAIVIPSFILSLVSFVAEISELCEKDSDKSSKLTGELSDLSERIAESGMNLYKEGGYKDQPYIEGKVPKGIIDTEKESLKYMIESTSHMRASLFFTKCQVVCKKIMFVGYIILFLSLVFSP